MTQRQDIFVNPSSSLSRKTPFDNPFHIFLRTHENTRYFAKETLYLKNKIYDENSEPLIYTEIDSTSDLSHSKILIVSIFFKDINEIYYVKIMGAQIYDIKIKSKCIIIILNESLMTSNFEYVVEK